MGMQKWQNICVKILQIGVAAVFFVPLVYSSATIFPFIFPKSIAFRILIELLAIPYVFLILTDASYRPRRSRISLAIFALLAIETLATVFGIDPLRSFWGNHERMMGLFMYMHVVLFFVMAISVYRTKEEWKKLLFYAVVAGAIVAVLGYVQYFSESFLHEHKGGRIYSTFGNSIYLAAYLLFQIYLLLWFALGEKRKLYRFALFALLFLELIAFFWAHTRGATIALIVSVVCFVMLLVYRRFKTRKGLIAVVVATPVILFLIFYLLGQSSVFGHIKVFSVFNEISVRMTTAQTRLLNWQVGLHAWTARPVLGWGPETYYMAFNKFYDPRFFFYGQYETWQDHSHNFLIDKLIDSGILGLAAFLSIFIFAAIEFLRSGKRTGEWRTSSVFIAALVAYFIQNLFAFDTLGVWIMIYAILGYAHISAVSEDADKGGGVPAPPPIFMKVDPTIRLTGMLGFIVAIMALVFLANVEPFTVSVKTIKAGSMFAANPMASYDMIVGALEKPSPYKAESRDELSKVVNAILRGAQNLTRDDATRIMLKAYSEYKKNLAAHPRDVYFHLSAAQWSMALASFFDPAYFLDAEDYLLKAKELSPKRQQIYFSLMRLYILRGRYPEAAALGKEAVELAKNVPKSHWQYGEALARAGEKEAGYREMKSAFNYDVTAPLNDWTAQEMDFYINLARENKDEAEADWWTGVINFNQNNYKEAYAQMSRADRLGYTPNIFEHLVQYLNAADAIGKPLTDFGMLERYKEKSLWAQEQEIGIQTARIFLARGEKDKAKEILTELLRKYPRTLTAERADSMLKGL